MDNRDKVKKIIEEKFGGVHAWMLLRDKIALRAMVLTFEAGYKEGLENAKEIKE